MRMLIVDDRSRQEFIVRILRVDLSKRKWTAEFKPYRIQRSIKQNRLLHIWLKCISDETGNDIETLKDYFKRKYLPVDVKKTFDVQVEILTHTSYLDTKQMTDFLDKINFQMANEGIFLPNPSDLSWNDFYVKYGLE